MSTTGPDWNDTDSLKSNKIEGKTLDTFPGEWRDDFRGLAFLGYLTDVVTIPQHEFVLKTLSVGEKIQVSQIVRPHEGTLGYGKAFKTAIVAASLVSIDGEAIMVAEKKVSVILQKYRYVVNTFYEPIVDLLYLRCVQLENRQLEVMKELGVFNNETVETDQVEAQVNQAIQNSPEVGEEFELADGPHSG